MDEITRIQLINRTIDVARRYVGQKEATGRNDGPFVEMLQKYVEGPGETWLKGAPWCACFASYSIHMAAAELDLLDELKFIKSASSSQIAERAHANGTFSPDPFPEVCIAIEKASPGQGKTYQHTCLANCSPGHWAPGQDFFFSVDGNWRDQVCHPSPPHKVADYDFVKIT